MTAKFKRMQIAVGGNKTLANGDNEQCWVIALNWLSDVISPGVFLKV